MGWGRRAVSALWSPSFFIGIALGCVAAIPKVAQWVRLDADNMSAGWRFLVAPIAYAVSFWAVWHTSGGADTWALVLTGVFLNGLALAGIVAAVRTAMDPGQIR